MCGAVTRSYYGHINEGKSSLTQAPLPRVNQALGPHFTVGLLAFLQVPAYGHITDRPPGPALPRLRQLIW